MKSVLRRVGKSVHPVAVIPLIVMCAIANATIPILVSSYDILHRVAMVVRTAVR